jgi:hypothetical protein
VTVARVQATFACTIPFNLVRVTMTPPTQRIPFKPWATERLVNASCFDRKRFDAIPTRVVNPNDPARGRQPSSPQLAWDARRRHAPCSIPIPELWGMDCLYGRLDEEEAYIRRLWTMTASNPAPPDGVVSLELVCYDRPLVPYRWPTSGRPTVSPDAQFSQRGCVSIAGENFARDSGYALYLSSLMADNGDPGRFVAELRKEYKNRCAGVLLTWAQVEYYQVPIGLRRTLYPRTPDDWVDWEVSGYMTVPLPAVVVYRGSRLIMGDQLHWAIFRSEWVVSVFARFITDAHHRLLLWRLPPRVRESIRSMTIHGLLDESGYDVREAEQLLTLEEGYPWEASVNRAHRESQAVPLQWVGREPRIREVNLQNEPRLPTADPRAHGWPRNREVAVALVEADASPGYPPARWDVRVEEPRSLLGGQGPLPGCRYPEDGERTSQGSHGHPTAIPGRDPVGADRVTATAGTVSHDGVGECLGWTVGESDPHTEVPSRGYEESERGLIDVRELNAYLAHYGRCNDLYGYLGRDGLTAATLGRTMCHVFASRDIYRQRAQDLEQELVDLRQDVEAQRLHTHMAVRSLQLLNAELTAVTGMLSRGRGRVEEVEGEWRGRGNEGERGGDNESGGHCKRPRATDR